MGIANAQRTLNYIRTLTEFISQDEYKNVVPMFSIMNEPVSSKKIASDARRGADSPIFLSTAPRSAWSLSDTCTWLSYCSQVALRLLSYCDGHRHSRSLVRYPTLTLSSLLPSTSPQTATSRCTT